MTLLKGAAETDRASLIGVGLMVIVALLGALDAVIVRLMSPEVHPFIIGFTRALFGLIVVLPWLLRHPEVMRSEFRFRHVLRAALKLASLIAFFGAYAAAPLADVTAIAFTTPIFVTLGAWVFLSEKPRLLRVVAVLTGFAGVVLVLGPGKAGGIAPGLWLALLGALLTAVIQLLLKPMTARDSTQTLVAWNLVVTVPIAVIPAALVWKTPELWQWGFLALQGALGAAAMALVTRAMSLAEASLIVPIDFLRLPLVAGLAYLLFGQSVVPTTWIGAAAIFAATLLMARTARSRRGRFI